LNKDALIGKMKLQIESLLNAKNKLEKEMGVCRLWAVKHLEMIKEERTFRMKVDDYLEKILCPTVKRKMKSMDMQKLLEIQK
jgi:hypothetical protein